MGAFVSVGGNVAGDVIAIEGNRGTITISRDMSPTQVADQLRKLDGEIAALEDLDPEAKAAARKELAEAVEEAETEEPIGKLIARKLTGAADALKKAGDATGGATKVIEALGKIATLAGSAALFG